MAEEQDKASEQYDLARILAAHFASRPWEEMAEDRAHLRTRIRENASYDINEATRSDCMSAETDVLDAMARVPAVEAAPVAWRWRYPNTAWETVFERKAWFDDGDERLIVEPLYTAPPPAWKPPREAVARIIEPWAWGIIANIEHTERAADDRAKALKKADAILALQPEQAG